ncbi:hypothetical protein ABMA28_004237 [Loxostege sticticalis]|uniref:Integrase catalytic domain-containing protein n=1 Tax=Loxostege sticticalis TaxID=481309 RepID=A0ABD0SUV4_LOXSC
MADSKDLEKLIKKRSALKSKLTIFNNYVTLLKTSPKLSPEQLLDLEGRFDKFEAIYPIFDDLQSDIELLSDDPADECQDREQFEDQYHKLAASARSLLGARLQRDLRDGSVSCYEDVQASNSKLNCVRLPKIDLPVFHGNYQHWLKFRDTFTSLIHSRQDMDDINKLHYLHASLKGSALLVIDNLDFKADNYESAWKLLCDRYDNKRLLVNNHVQALFNVERMQKESCDSIRNLIDVTNKNLRALSSLNQPTEYWDTLIIHMMSEKLDSVTYRVWEEHRNTLTDPPSLKIFITFLSNRADLLETIQEKGKIQKDNSNYKQNSNFLIDTFQNNKNKTINNNHNKSNNIFNNKNLKAKQNIYKLKSYKCILCNESHYLFNCEKFRSLSIEDRIQKAKETKVCLNCLRPGHIDSKCSLVPCRYCKKRHNTLLHLSELEPTPVPAIPVNSINHLANDSNSSKQFTTPSHVLLSTALVKVLDGRGGAHSARLLLDNGSTANIVTQSLCGKLGLSRRDAYSTVTGINQHTSQCTQSCSLTIMSIHDDFKFTVDCLILPEITKCLPSSFINIESIPLPKGIQLADPTFNIPSVIDILVGAEVFWSVLGNNQINLGKNQPKLYETKLGWLVSGHVARLQHSFQNPVCNFLNEKPNPDLTRFWELDTVAAKHSLSPEERACEQSFLLNTTRKEDGRFVVTMPLKEDPSVLGDSFQQAKCRFLSLERRFNRDPGFKEMYFNFLLEYEHLGHMTENKEPSANCLPQSPNYFMPHHGVIRESSTTTKLRTVFDASAPTTSGLSLNNILMVGPTVQEDLFSILLRFRQHKYVVTGDIEKMYRAIELDPAQRPLQQIIFRTDPKQPLKTFTLNTVSFGTACAPYLATKCLVSLASSAQDGDVKQAIERDFYVDDYLGGSSSIEDTVRICKGVISTLESAKFNLRKLKSNNQLILNQISPSSPNSNNVLDLSDIDLNAACKTLGLNWICDTDYLSFSININVNKKVTKRHILSVISQIFDPLGLVGPCVIEAKIIMQRLWIEQCTWDEEVSLEIKQLWLAFANTLPFLNELKIDRWVLTNDSVSYEVHAFSDASERAYGVCIYIRSIDSFGAVTVKLLTSKNRVAPIKPLSTPRLELSAALLAARLCTKVLASLTIPISNCRFWCDSTIVLGWLKTPPSELKSFVRNRVHEIQESTEGHTWSYVPSADNPADLVSRGLKADLISSSSLWWSGPTFLLRDQTHWPKKPNERHDLPELISSSVARNNQPNADVVSCFVDLDSSVDDVVSCFINKKSNFKSLQRSMAYLLRFIYNCRNKNNKISGHLSVEELQNSFNLIIRKSQVEMFPDEYAILKSQKSLPNKNRLLSLSPFLDSNDIIRVGGRLNNSPYNYDVKHPILLCSKHHLTIILFDYFHKKYLHAGPQLLLANIRQTFWPLGGRNLSKKCVNKCVRCCRYKAKTVQPIMGQLPSSRTELEFPFLHCSVDYAGPVLIADRKGRGCKLLKSFLAIFICNSVKALHIELVTALSSEAYLAALNRFVSRRGKPQSITSDNGTNFVGTYNELSTFLLHRRVENQTRHHSEGI